MILSLLLGGIGYFFVRGEARS
ncbi:MAG: hypothetical protein M3547_14820 [Acidobacteriota bacterium]|nr:hypothetical protein [Acidobacteriota bacterium]